MILTQAEKLLMAWLSEGDGQYGECYGPTLDALIAKGLVKVGDEASGLNNTFIAKGTDIMFRTVSLTVDGREAMAEIETGDNYGA